MSVAAPPPPRTTSRGLGSLLPTGPIARLLSIWLLVCLGGWVFTVTLAVYAFHRSGAGGVAVVTAARLLPAMIAAPITGSAVDRSDRGRVAAVACLAQALCLGLAAALALGDSSLAAIVPLAAAAGVAATTPRPALQALLPALARTPEELIRATAAWGALDGVAFLLAGALAAAAVIALGTGPVMALAAGTFAVAAALAAGLPSAAATGEDSDVHLSALGSLLGGLRAVVAAPPLRAPFALFAGMLLLEGLTDVQLVALSLGNLRLGDGGPGLLYAVWGAGGVIGSAAIVWLVRRRGYGLALAVGALSLAAGLALAGIRAVPVVVLAMIPAGAGFAQVEFGVMGVVPRLADDAVIGRVYGLMESLYAGAAGVGALLAPVLIRSLGAAGSLIATGLAFGGWALLLWPSYRRLDAGQEEAGRIRRLLRGVPFLAPLPLPQLERLVRRAHWVAIEPGVDIVRLGERGDEFFLIEEGVADVVEYGRRLHAGDGFGEIALLRDMPRTATVRAATPVHAWALNRTTFISAVLGHGDASHLADAIVAEHLARPRVGEHSGGAGVRDAEV